jgi:O-antigen/teichoic acid export membrane protein
MALDQSSYLRRGALALASVAMVGYLVDYAFNLGLTHFLSPHDYGAGGHGVLQLLVAGNFAWAVAALSALWLQYRGRAKVVLVVSVAALVVDSALNLLLIPRFGMVGAAAGTGATLCGGAIALIAAHLRTPRPET